MLRGIYRGTFIIVCICFFLRLCAYAQLLPKKQNIYDPSIFHQENINIWEQFNEQFQNKWRIIWNPVTGTPHRISGHSIEITDPITKENVEEITRIQLDKYKSLLQINPEALVFSKAFHDEMPRQSGTSSGTWYVYYRQTYNGIPVYGGSVRLIIRNQNITVLCSDYYPGINIGLDEIIVKEKAIENVNRDMGGKEILIPVSTKLIVYPKTVIGMIYYYLTWQVTMPVVHVPSTLLDAEDVMQQQKGGNPEKIPVQWSYFVNARTGDIIKRINIMDYADLSGTVTGMVHQFTPSDTPEEADIAHMTVNLTQNAMVYETETDPNGNYLFTGLDPDMVSLEAHLAGPHVTVHNNETPDPDATHTASFTVPGTHDWDWSSDDPSPNDVETNAFYHVGFVRDWFLQGDPFNIIPDPYPMPVYVRAGAYCNASASSSGLYFGSGDPNYCEDFCLCADIIYHEYTHRITRTIYLLAGASPEGPMNEGWSDYYGATLTGNPAHGAGCYSGRNIDTPDHRFPDDWTGEEHEDGIIFSGAIWDTRTMLGAEYVDGLALRALKQITASFTEYLEAILEEDDDPSYSPDPNANNDLSDGTPNIEEICYSFYDLHGIYHSYCSGYTNGPMAVITSPPPLEFNGFSYTASPVTITGTAHSGAQPMDYFDVEYASIDDPNTWLTSGITLTGGGTSEVIDSTLATWDITGVPDGEYLVLLTVTDIGGNTATFQITMCIDSLLRDGWPQSMTEYFKYPAVSGNVDPNTPELEIVINSEYDVYIFYEDGSLYAPSPLSTGGYSFTAPALADLDLDGDLEIIVSSLTGLRVWHHTGSEIFTLEFGSGSSHYIYASPVVYDLDNDGDLEIIAGGRDGDVYIVHHDGSPFTFGPFTWPITTGGAIRSTPAVADLDGDYEVEIIVGSEDGNVYAWNLDGTDVAGFWPVNIGESIISSPAIGNIDGDPNHSLEVVAGADDGNIYAWNHDGSTFSGSWPVAIPYPYNDCVWTSPALADLDCNGDLEIIINGMNAVLKVLEHDGSYMEGWSPNPLIIAYYNSPVVGDLDGDNTPEIIISTHTDNRIYAYHPDGTLVNEFPRFLSEPVYRGAPHITDLDLDGYPEIIQGYKGLFVWSLTSTYNTSVQDWPTFHRDVYHTGYYGPISGIVLLLDISGSMSLSYDGTWGAPIEEQRLSLAKEAIYPFLEMLNDFNAGKANFGIATFPSDPSADCNAQVVTPMTVIIDERKDTAIAMTIPGLNSVNNTPLLNGIEIAMGMFCQEKKRALILLSDGYHNCPYFVNVGDPEVTDLIDLLNTNGIRVFTIGFGSPTDVDHPLLEAFADETTPTGFIGSQFFDVTTPSFDPNTWDPGVALQETYKAILTDALNLETVVDPRGIITDGETMTFDVKINEYDQRVSFFLSWATHQEDRLDLLINASDGQMVPTTGTGIHFHEGKTYKILTVDNSFLQQAGKISPSPWNIVIAASGLGMGDRETYQYSVISDSSLKMETALDKNAYKTGDPMILSARITARGAPVTNLTNISVTITRPEEGKGNWFASNKVDPQDLQEIPQTYGGEPIPLHLRKALYLTKVRKVEFPSQKIKVILPLYDDGTHGDTTADDGVYTNLYSNTVKEGTYSFYFHASGQTEEGMLFERDDILQKYVTVNVMPEDIQIRAVYLTLIDNQRRFKIVVIPRDMFGNYLGPGYADIINLTTTRGKYLGKVRDELDGSYTQILDLPSIHDSTIDEIGINLMGASVSFNLRPSDYLDLDGDGYTKAAGDCNDQNPGVFPGAPELINGIDDNCNGEIDEYAVLPCMFKAPITATGQSILDAVNVSKVFIGFDTQAMTFPSPGAPLDYTVYTILEGGLLKDFREAGSSGPEEWKMIVQVGDKADPNQRGFFPELSWNPNDLCPPDPNQGHLSLYVEDARGKRKLLIWDMHQTTQYQTKEGDGVFLSATKMWVANYHIVWSREVAIEMHMPVGWSMISLQLIPQSTLASDLFPDAVVAYGYAKDTGYFCVDRLEFGKGYWILFHEEKTYTIIGQPIYKYISTVHETGWEMIGGCTFPSKATTDSCNIVVIYKYKSGVGYQRVPVIENLMPGEGYWILIEDENIENGGRLLVNDITYNVFPSFEVDGYPAVFGLYTKTKFSQAVEYQCGGILDLDLILENIESSVIKIIEIQPLPIEILDHTGQEPPYFRKSFISVRQDIPRALSSIRPKESIILPLSLITPNEEGFYKDIVNIKWQYDNTETKDHEIENNFIAILYYEVTQTTEGRCVRETNASKYHEANDLVQKFMVYKEGEEVFVQGTEGYAEVEEISDSVSVDSIPIFEVNETNINDFNDDIPDRLLSSSSSRSNNVLNLKYCVKVRYKDHFTSCPSNTNGMKWWRPRCTTTKKVPMMGLVVELWDRDTSNADDLIGAYILHYSDIDNYCCISFEWDQSERGEDYPDPYILTHFKVRDSENWPDNTIAGYLCDEDQHGTTDTCTSDAQYTYTWRSSYYNNLGYSATEIRQRKIFGDASDMANQVAMTMAGVQKFLRSYEGYRMTGNINVWWDGDYSHDDNGNRWPAAVNANWFSAVSTNHQNNMYRRWDIGPHESGHLYHMQLFEQDYICGEGCNGMHSIDQPNTFGCATREGWANWVVAITWFPSGKSTGRPTVLNESIEPGDLEFADCNDNSATEVMVTRAFWDLYDRNVDGSDSADQTRYFIAKIWDVFFNGDQEYFDGESEDDGCNMYDYLQNSYGLGAGTDVWDVMLFNEVHCQDPW